MTEETPLATDPAPPADRTDPPTSPTRRRGVGPFSTRQLLTVLAVVVGAGLLLGLVTTPVGVAPPPTARPRSSAFAIGPAIEGLHVGDLAPELAGVIDGKPVQLLDLDGQPVTLAQLRGHPVWINFWASWCPPCQEETPVLRAIFKTHRAEGLIVLGVSVQESSPQDIRDYVVTYGLEYQIGFDATSAVFKTYRVSALPAQFFLDRDGVIRYAQLGQLTEVEAERILAPILAGVPLASPSPAATSTGPQPSATWAGPTSGMTSR